MGASVFGDLGIIALLFIGVVFGSGILTQTDFNAFPWHMLFLLGGGHVLGKPSDHFFYLFVEVGKGNTAPLFSSVLDIKAPSLTSQVTSF